MTDSAKKIESTENVSAKDSIEHSNTNTLNTPVETTENIQDLSLAELITLLENSIKTYSIQDIKVLVEDIKIDFYKKLKLEFEEKKQAFIDEGGEEIDFLFSEPLEATFKELYTQYKKKRDELRKEIEAEQIRNLDIRKGLITELESLTNTEESLQHTFETFRSIQERWKNAGPVHASERKGVWESYHLQLARFYDYIKINKELRDLDLRKNFEAKIELCEKAESLILEPQIVSAFSKLQDLHEQWREIGPVQHEQKEDVWQRFKAATSVINKKHQDYFQSLKEQEKNNLALKTELCEQVEEIASREIKTVKTWKKASEEIIAIQKKWKTIGYAPQKQNTQIFERFSAACDTFFTKKRDFFQAIHEQEKHNKQLKTELCEQAEIMSSRTDWKEATKDFIALQKQWKEIGTVPLRDSNKLWNRFRKACDTFFTAKNAFFDTQKGVSIENIDKKKDVLSRLSNLQQDESQESLLEKIQNLQREWVEIGNVPLREREQLNTQYQKLIQEKFKLLEIPEDKKQKILYKVKIENLQSQGSDKIFAEESKLIAKRKSIESELFTLENNIGFFAQSKNAEKVLSSMNTKIQNSKDEIERINKQLKLIQNLDTKNT